MSKSNMKIIDQHRAELDRQAINEFNDTGFTWSSGIQTHNVDVEQVGRTMLDDHEPVRDFNLEAETRRADESQDAYNNRLRALHAKREERQGITHVDPWNRPLDPEAIDPEILAVLNERVDSQDVFHQKTGAYQLDEEHDAVWAPDAIRDCAQLNIYGTARYTGLRPDDHIGPIWNCPMLPPSATDRGSKTSEGGSSQYGTRLDIGKFERHVRITTKARRYHGIEAICLRKDGTGIRTPERLQKQRKAAPVVSGKGMLRALRKARK